MKGKTVFSSAEADLLRSLIRQLNDADNNTQKSFRNKMRKIGFYISDFTTKKGFTVEDFDALIRDKQITIGGNEAPSIQTSSTIKKLNNERGSNRKIIEGLAPIVNDDSQVLVLGTMPGENSLVSNEYYANSRNIFWKVISHLFNGGQPFHSYSEKEECLKKNHIALWDTLKLCKREGSLDGTISEEIFNDIDGLLKKYPSILRIVYNGKRPTEYYVSKDIESVIALSTSPSNRQYSDEKRIISWKKALHL